MTTISFLLGTVDGHFDENAKRAIDDFLAGRPIFDGQIPPTTRPHLYPTDSFPETPIEPGGLYRVGG